MHTNTKTATGMPVRSYAQRSKGGRGTHRPRENTLYRDRWNTFYGDTEHILFRGTHRQSYPISLSHTPSVSRAAVSRVASAIKADKEQQTAGETQTRERLSMKPTTHAQHTCANGGGCSARENKVKVREEMHACPRAANARTGAARYAGASALGRPLAARAGLRQGARGCGRGGIERT
jgi:hypothetical protein